MGPRPKRLLQKTKMSVRIKRVFLISLLVPLWVFLRSVYRDRISAFGCFDDCFNYMGGYFLLSGKRLFSEIFFNHMPLMAYISAAIQHFTKPESLYMLIYEHRMALIYFFIAADVLLIARFGLIGFGFALLYETTKGFLFGERFLAEAIIVYPIVYLFGLAWERLRGRKIARLEIILSAILAWFVVFSREPYIPLALILFGVIIWPVKNVWNRLAIGFFLLLCATSILFHDPSEFWFNVVTVNKLSVAATEATANNLAGIGIMQIFLYPFFLFFGGSWNLFRVVETTVGALFLLAGLLLTWQVPRSRLRVVYSFVLLGIANIRSVAAGDLYYGAFHHIQWYGLMIFAVLLFFQDLWRQTRVRLYALFGIVIFGAITVWAVASPQSYLHENVDRQTEFTTNYAQYYTVGEVVRRLSDFNDSLFLDEWDDLIYWQAKRLSPYRYSWYTSVMPQFETYRAAREDMFANTPPTFYYGRCSQAIGSALSLPEDKSAEYVRLMQKSKPSCLWIHRAKLSTISSDQWQSVVEFQYSR